MTTTRLDGLQSLRGIAAFAVLFQHVTYYVLTAKGLSYLPLMRIDLGSTGVEIFFVLSGFVMAGCMSQGKAFLWNRALRIYPAFWLAIGVSSLILSGGFSWTFDWLSTTLLPTEHLNATYLIPYWTLVYEVAFYLVTFGVILSGKERATNICLLWLVSIVVIAQYRDIPVLAPGAWVFFSKLDIFFILGMLSAVHREALLKIPRVFLIVAAVAFWVIGTGFGQVSRMAYDMLIALSFTTAVTICATELKNKALVWFGDVSFGVYLIHVPITMVAIKGITELFPSIGAAPLWALTMVCALVGAVLFGVVEHQLYLTLKKATRVRRLRLTATVKSEGS